MKTVKRTYFSKKLNKTVTKVYKYDKKYTYKVKANKLVTKKGTFAKNYLKVLKSIPDFDEHDAVRDLIDKYRKIKKSLNLTEALLIVRDPHNKINTFLHNMGINFEDIIQELKQYNVNVDVAYLNDTSHWIFKGDTLIVLPDGREAYFIYQYNAGFAVEVN